MKQEDKAEYLNYLGDHFYLYGERDRAMQCYRRSTELAPTNGYYLLSLAFAQLKRGDYKESKKLHNKANAIFASLGDKWGVATTLNNLGLIEADLGNYPNAVRLYRQSLEVSKKIRDQRAIAKISGNLAIIERATGNYSEARRLFNQSRVALEKLGDRSGLALCLSNLGALEHIAENPQRSIPTVSPKSGYHAGDWRLR